MVERKWTYEVHELSSGYSAIVYDEHGQAIADHLSEDVARLIAAAPSLLEALEQAQNFIENTEDEFGEDLRVGNTVRAAISLARGEEDYHG